MSGAASGAVAERDLLDLMQRPLPRFDGREYARSFDDDRLTGQLRRIVGLMRDGAWRTLAEIEGCTGDPQASISAQLRHLRKPRFGAHIVEKRPRGERARGLYEYRLQGRTEGTE